MEANGILTLLTDFGDTDHFVGTMKGVILSRNGEAKINDITHLVPRQDVWTGSYLLQQAYPYYPPGTVHLAIVDPGVGTKRKVLAAQAGEHFFVAPDNGLLAPILDQNPSQVFECHRKFALEEISDTFHGRDIFSPLGAELSRNRPLEELGTPLKEYTPLKGWQLVTRGNEIEGTVVHIDHFGNLLTNIPVELFDSGPFEIRMGPHRFQRLAGSYSHKKGQLLALASSNGCLEFAIQGEDAAETTEVSRGQVVVVTKEV